MMDMTITLNLHPKVDVHCVAETPRKGASSVTSDYMKAASKLTTAAVHHSEQY